GQVAHDRRARAERAAAVILKRLQRRSGVLLELDPLKEAETPDLADPGRLDRKEPVAKLPAPLGRRGRQAQPAVLVDGRDRRRAGKRVATEGRRVRTLREIAQRSGERDRAHRYPSGDRLREAEDVGHDAELLDR